MREGGDFLEGWLCGKFSNVCYTFHLSVEIILSRRSMGIITLQGNHLGLYLSLYRLFSVYFKVKLQIDYEY